MIIHQQKLKNVFKDCQLKAGQYIIKPKYVIKTLGHYIRSDLKLDSDIGKLCSNLNYRINKINQIKKYTNFETRLKFINANVMSKLNFCLPFYIGAEFHLIKRLYNVQMKAARAAIGSFASKKVMNIF